MTTLHLRKINSHYKNPQSIDWICTFNDKTGICTGCATVYGKPSVAFLGRHIDFISHWLNMGNINGVAYHQIVDTID